MALACATSTTARSYKPEQRHRLRHAFQFMGAALLGDEKTGDLTRRAKARAWSDRPNGGLPLLSPLAEPVRWKRARDGDGQLLLIVGEPGLGKSRLIEEFHAKLSETPHTWAEFSCSQLLQNTPLHPIADWGRQRNKPSPGNSAPP